MESTTAGFFATGEQTAWRGEGSRALALFFQYGYADEEISEWRRAGGEISFLAKPFLGEELLARVATLVAARRAGEGRSQETDGVRT